MFSQRNVDMGLGQITSFCFWCHQGSEEGSEFKIPCLIPGLERFSRRVCYIVTHQGEKFECVLNLLQTVKTGLSLLGIEKHTKEKNQS